MPVLMKDKYYNYDSLHDLASRIKAVFPSFQENDFVDHIMNETWDALELKARMRQITINLGNICRQTINRHWVLSIRSLPGILQGITIMHSYTFRILLKSMDRMNAIGTCQWPP